MEATMNSQGTAAMDSMEQSAAIRKAAEKQRRGLSVRLSVINVVYCGMIYVGYCVSSYSDSL